MHVDRWAEAVEFLADPDLGTSARRLAEVCRDLSRTGTYWHTPDELEWGAQVAWRNATACLGRVHWRGLAVRDQRQARTPAQVAEQCVEHLGEASANGRVRLLLTVCAPAPPGRPGRGVRILNGQLIGYAGHRSPTTGDLIGDPANVAWTHIARGLGWRGTGGPYDVLPLLLQDQTSGDVTYHPLPAEVIHEVPITHPGLPGLDELGLRWYSHPAIANQRLRIGGVDYPTAPFSAWYTASEVAGNLARRPGVLEQVARLMGLELRPHTLWRDRALVELVQAVLHSYRTTRHPDATQGVSIVDHHTAVAGFLRHEQRERREGRPVYARLAQLLPGSGAAATDLYTRTDFQDRTVLPAFLPHTSTTTPASAGGCPVRTRP
ncbi:nitric oxide synthase oxygenase [Kibdelosporangium lantanae]